jgi:hypothetical protein
MNPAVLPLARGVYGFVCVVLRLMVLQVLRHAPYRYVEQLADKTPR